MLSTIIYRSCPEQGMDADSLNKIVAHSRHKNERVSVTGILLYDGTHFFQVLEGPVEAVNRVFDRISGDARHYQIVEIMRDYAPSRRFGKLGMETVDLRDYPEENLLLALLQKSTINTQFGYDDRVLKFIKAFIAGRWRHTLVPQQQIVATRFITQDTTFKLADDASHQPCQFAMQPIIDAVDKQVVALEALIRSPQGGSPEAFFAALSGEQLYTTDLQSKRYAFELAKKIDLGRTSISVNLLPMSLITVPNAVEFLLDEIARCGLVPQQVIIEITESEMISRFDEFEIVIRRLKSAGLVLAIDDFGAGYAGLSLLARFQPDRIKIDRAIISNVHKSEARQAIVRAIIECCSSLEIEIIAEGVEQPEEWHWLDAVGIRYFQGFLFAKPQLNGVGKVAYPLESSMQ